MKDRIIRLLFRLLGNSNTRLFKIPYLFGVLTDENSRKRKWENSLIRIWQDKDLLDWLYYQAEGDKERVWQNKIDKRLAQGARIRTLFIVYSARRAYLERLKGRMKTGEEVKENDQEISKGQKVYQSLIDIGN